LKHILARALLWYQIVRSFVSLTVLGWINLFLSAIFDILMSLYLRYSFNPKTFFSGIYLAKKWSALFYVRGGH